MNPDWGSQSNYYVGIPTQYSEITLKKDTSYVLIFHKDTLDGSGINKPQFWAILDKDTDINDYDVSLQKYSGERYDCEQQHDHKNKHLRQATWNCAVPPETEQGC